MKALYVTSVEPHSGKSAVCISLGRILQSQGHKIGYLKPISTQPWRTPDGHLADEDAAFACKILGLQADPTALSPVIITPSLLRARLSGMLKEDLLDKILGAVKEAARDRDLLLLEGGHTLRQGHAMGLSNLLLAETIGAPALAVLRYHDELQIVDDALAARLRLGDQCMGVLLNHVPQEAQDFVDQYAIPYLEGQGVQVFGTLPRNPRLSALSLGELTELLDAQVLTETFDPDALVETFTVGAMTVDAALSRFRRQRNKAVITGGDRADIQLAALETSTVALILTGNLHPSPVVIHQAESLRVPILLVKNNTMETVDVIEHAYGKTRLGQPEKLEAFVGLLQEHLDWKRFFPALGLEPPTPG
jgi:hypothetical protein